MRKQRMINTLLWVISIILLVLVIVSVLNFKAISDGKVVDYTSNEQNSTNKKEENKFVNETEMSEAELRDLIINKHDSLSKLIRNAKYYNVSEVAEGYSSSDDATKMALTEDFVNSLRDMLSENAFKYYNDKMNEAVLKANSGISSRIYVVDKDIFSNLSEESAIAWSGFDRLELNLISATNELIESSIITKTCNDDKCENTKEYKFNLLKENEEYKISNFGIELITEESNKTEENQGSN